MASTSFQATNNGEMTKIYICPAKESFDPAIRQHFGQFGKVESIAYYFSKKKFGYAFVQFDNAESASAAIAESKHEIGGEIVKAKAAHSQQKTPSVSGLSKLEKLNVASPINKLNEDCLREIFKRLYIADLLSTADVCNKFRKVAKDLVKPVQYLNLKMSSEISLPLLRLFASEIQSIELDFGLFSCLRITLILDYIATLDSNPNSKLTKIKIRKWKINREFVNRLKQLFSRITTLSIDGKAKNDKTIAEMLNVCTELKELKLSYINFAQISKIKFPKLETFEICNTPKLRDNIVDQFLSSNRQLKTFSMDWNTTLTSKAVRNLNSNIEKLELFGNIKLSPNLNELNGLKSLKSLALYSYSVPLVESLAKKRLPIEELKLSGSHLNGTIINDIKSLKYLKRIWLTDYNSHDNNLLVEMVKALPQLKYIDLDDYRKEIGIKRIKEMVKSAPKLEYIKLNREDGVVIDSQDFESILELVQRRSNKTKLRVVLSGCGCQLKVPKLLRKKSREWLKFHVTDYFTFFPSIETLLSLIS